MRHLLLAALAIAAPASAAVFSGDTTGDPTYNRVLSGIPPTGSSLVGTAVRYDVLQFQVTSNGGYDFLLTGDQPVNWDTFLTIYANSFDPGSAMTNVIAASDDFPSIGISGFTGLNLLANTSYFAVIAGFSNSDAGRWTLDITGEGAVVAVGGAIPEPASWAMMIGGFGFIGAAMRRRSVSVRFA